MDYLKIIDRDEAARAYAEENPLLALTDDERGSIQARSFRDGTGWYERQVLKLVGITPDAMRQRIRLAESEFELLQLSTAVMVNAGSYKPEVCPVLAQEIALRGSQLLRKHAEELSKKG